MRRLGLPERLIAVLLIVVAVDFATNTMLFESANSFELRRDDAERIAENLVLASRALERVSAQTRPRIAQALSTDRFTLEWVDTQKRHRGPLGLANLRAQVVEFEPVLARSDIELHLEEVPGRGNIGGSMQLDDRSVLKFHTHANAAWKLTAGRFISLVLPTLLLVALAWVLLRAALGPLRAVIGATRQFGSGPPQIVAERGPEEMRQLIRAVNEMQERIHQSLKDRTQTMLAIGHDLKTPLARMRLRLDDTALDPDLRDGFAHDVDEMRMLIESIQAYVDTGGEAIASERIDVAVMAQTLVDTAADHGADATYAGVGHAVVRARPVQIRRALSNLIENALHYGGNVHVTVSKDGDAVVIAIEDDGPGIASERIADAMQPFVRLDTARARYRGHGAGPADRPEGGAHGERHARSGEPRNGWPARHDPSSCFWNRLIRFEKCTSSCAGCVAAKLRNTLARSQPIT
ncbi:ATP-binding protein [Novosphingobium sp. 1949]|uniref:histidine kinase n=1 Tax=Novosphingobium organovorum TaxID=2930092 RepID=A0ABT0BEB6_9SPHN|nr:ATP-binding protein [Novosphingobium organovorum]